MALGVKTGGRSAGTPNKAGRSVRDRFEEVFHMLQEHETANLQAWAQANPTDYYKLANKLVPAAVDARVEHSGQVGITQILGSLDGSSADLPGDE